MYTVYNAQNNIETSSFVILMLSILGYSLRENDSLVIQFTTASCILSEKVFKIQENELRRGNGKNSIINVKSVCYNA